MRQGVCVTAPWLELPAARRVNVLQAWLRQQLGDVPRSLVERLVAEWSGQGGVWPARGAVLRSQRGLLFVERFAGREVTLQRVFPGARLEFDDRCLQISVTWLQDGPHRSQVRRHLHGVDRNAFETLPNASPNGPVRDTNWWWYLRRCRAKPIACSGWRRNSAPELVTPAIQRELDMIAATGEQVSVGLLSIALQQEGLEAVSYNGWQVPIRTDSSFTKARIQSIDDSRVRAELAAGKVVVITGFQGVDEGRQHHHLGAWGLGHLGGRRGSGHEGR
jgi:hypothetical protein